MAEGWVAKQRGGQNVFKLFGGGVNFCQPFLRGGPNFFRFLPSFGGLRSPDPPQRLLFLDHTIWSRCTQFDASFDAFDLLSMLSNSKFTLAICLSHAQGISIECTLFGNISPSSQSDTPQFASSTFFSQSQPMVFVETQDGKKL